MHKLAKPSVNLFAFHGSYLLLILAGLWDQSRFRNLFVSWQVLSKSSECPGGSKKAGGNIQLRATNWHHHHHHQRQWSFLSAFKKEQCIMQDESSYASFLKNFFPKEQCAAQLNTMNWNMCGFEILPLCPPSKIPNGLLDRQTTTYTLAAQNARRWIVAAS